ncbi:hypothetical protein [Pelagibacterium luteolum]|uniref:YCII-related domain-containing protein n=1 Tax=Pelagibacterium luteolum TaxID=440168 RepID=A0A1G7UGI0_9HYPH|nr:hypothetical protein [Pelagibacterium luteolum]SDG46613.1 hypothetical protein SAMN04487974_10354 [Pelagibacterium luteolum]
MPIFLAVYTMKREDLARFRAMPKAEQDAVDAKGLPLWSAWEEKNAAHLRKLGGMVGKTTRATKNGVGPGVNDFCGYVIVEAETAEAAAALFVDHPHVTVFPGDGVDVMPFLTGPDGIKSSA